MVFPIEGVSVEHVVHKLGQNGGPFAVAAQVLLQVPRIDHRKEKFYSYCLRSTVQHFATLKIYKTFCFFTEKYPARKVGARNRTRDVYYSCLML